MRGPGAPARPLQALSKRIHYGMFVAEAKFRKQTAEYTQLIQRQDGDAILELLTDRAVELKVGRRSKHGPGARPPGEARKMRLRTCCTQQRCRARAHAERNALVWYHMLGVGWGFVQPVRAGCPTHRSPARCFAAWPWLQVIERVRLKAATFGQELDVSGAAAGANGAGGSYKVRLCLRGAPPCLPGRWWASVIIACFS